jgi:hypothetical protein
VTSGEGRASFTTAGQAWRKERCSLLSQELAYSLGQLELLFGIAAPDEENLGVGFRMPSEAP